VPCLTARVKSCESILKRGHHRLWYEKGLKERRMPIQIEELYDRYAHLIYNRCLAILGNRSDAEDALQEVFVRVMKAAKDFRGESSPMTWLYRISTNHCLNVIRSANRSRAHARARLKDAQERSSASSYPDPEKVAAVRELLPSFDENTQRMAIHYFVDEMSQEEVAKELGLSVPTIRKRLRAFVEKSRKQLS